LCQTDLLAAARTAELEKYSKKTRRDADIAAKQAAALEKKANRKLRKTDSSRNKTSSQTLNPKAKLFWKGVAAVPRIFMSDEARARAREEDEKAKKYGTSQTPGNTSQKASDLHEASDLLVKSHAAFLAAEEAQRVAVDAEKNADLARAYAESTRQSYNICLSGKKSP
jgi:hypothetical protein